MPYWDWTSNATIPSFADQGPWKNGNIKVTSPNLPCSDDVTYRKVNYTILNADKLAGQVKTALEQETLMEFNREIEHPHDAVNEGIGGSSSSFANITYDP